MSRETLIKSNSPRSNGHTHAAEFDTLRFNQRVPRETLMFTDLDGTLIFSAAKKRPDDIVCEYKDGIEISCITPLQQRLLPVLSLIPITTRSIEQYRRIRFPKGFSPQYALTDNGGNLLVNGEPDREWAQHYLAMTHECAEEMRQCRLLLEQDEHRTFEVRTVDGLFLFTKSDIPESSLERLSPAAGGRLRCFSTGKKLYVLPAGLCKGSAARRLADRISPRSQIVCAGDSTMDIPLLNIADAAIFPDDIPKEHITAQRKLCAPRDRFPEFVTVIFDRINKDRNNDSDIY